MRDVREIARLRSQVEAAWSLGGARGEAGLRLHEIDTLALLVAKLHAVTVNFLMCSDRPAS